MRVEPRVSTELCALWLADAPEGDRAHRGGACPSRRSLEPCARARWPSIYGDPVGARIICPAAEPPPSALVEAAKAAGCALQAIDGPMNLLLAQCDLAIVGSAADLSSAGLLPALVVCVGGRPDRLV